MKKIYKVPQTRIVTSMLCSGMIATSVPPSDGVYNLGNQSTTPVENDNRNEETITPVEGGEALGKRRFYTGF